MLKRSPLGTMCGVEGLAGLDHGVNDVDELDCVIPESIRSRVGTAQPADPPNNGL
jgi:hypothetical protein